ncbi:MAG: hypothetical protein QW063_00710 [Candidatus Nanoarchaeia archaeon]
MSEFMLRPRQAILIQQKASKREGSDEASVIDTWRQYGIIEGKGLAKTGTQCTTGRQLYYEAKRTWVGAGYSQMELFVKVDGEIKSLKDMEDLPNVMLVQLTQYVEEAWSEHPWYCGALKGFLKGITGRVYDIHKVIEKDGVLHILLYHDPQAIVRRAQAEQKDVKQMQTLEAYLQEQKLELRRFNIIDVDKNPDRIYEILNAISQRPDVEITCVTETHPKLLKEKLPEDVRIVWIVPQERSGELPMNCYQFTPATIEHRLAPFIGDQLADARGGNKTPVLGITHIDKLLDVNKEQKVKEFLTKLNYKLADFDGLGLLAISYGAMDPIVAKSLVRAAVGV